MVMGSSSSPLLFFLSLPSSPQRSAIRGLHSSPLPSPKPLTKRRNHLRIKLPKTLETPPQNPPPLPLQTHQTPPQNSQLDEAREASAIAHLPVLGAEVEALEEAADPFPPAPAHRWLPNPVLDLGLRFTLLLVVQTLAAVWFLGSGRGNGSLEKRREGLEQGRVEGHVGRVVGEVSEFERRLQLIRAMVKEVREKERRDLAAGKDGIRDEIGRGLARSKKSSSTNSMSLNGKRETGESNEKRKLEALSSNAKSRNVSNGFGGSEVKDDDDDDANGGYQQIAYHSPVEESSQLHKTDEVRPPNSLTPRNLRNLETLTASSSRHDKSIEEKKLMLDDRNTQSPIKAAKMNRKNDDIDAEEKSWWLKLPYALGIFLRRGVERSGPRGLYSLNMDLSSENDDSPSYTVAFQDRGDATNFCYLLESFFEGLGDVSADVVPLTIQELSEAVESNELKLIVVRKGQLQLYAGQPLAEVETVLRSLMR
ncbi:hypothetical protein ACMD2_06909 [Ananas comosus]|uniref:Uncharacterized protein n=1 Tax=Ananas comosus TaxID=4615 RepID=A0A199VZM8_ANACO|nr:hypothetical protein ACMD2_06909 [Ananas comosus]